MNDDLYEEMYRVEQSHWWFQARVKIVRSLLARYVPRKSVGKPRVADLGCGCGLMLAALQDDYEGVGMDAFPQAIDFCARRGIHAESGFLPGPVPFADGSFDAALFLDVLEHLDDDVNSVATAARLLKPGGVIIATSPAYQWLWTSRDDFHQHKRRYTRGQFTQLFERPDLDVLASSYGNTLLFPLAVTERLVRKAKPLKEGEGDLKVPAAPINALFRATFAAERAAFGRVRLPFGLSVVCVARRN